jgi:hypothetical protein
MAESRRRQTGKKRFTLPHGSDQDGHLRALDRKGTSPGVVAFAVKSSLDVTLQHGHAELAGKTSEDGS